MKKTTTRIAGSSALAIGLIAACSTGHDSAELPELAPMHKEQFDQQLKLDLPEKYRAILEDYWVTDEEWNEVVSDFHACAADYGVRGVVGSDHPSFGLAPDRQQEIGEEYETFDEEIAQLDKEDELIWDCATRTLMVVGNQYFDPRNNPEGVHFLEATRRCLAHKGFPGLDGLSTGDIEELIDSHEFHSQATDDQQFCLQNPSYGDWQY